MTAYSRVESKVVEMDVSMAAHSVDVKVVDWVLHWADTLVGLKVVGTDAMLVVVKVAW